MFCPYCKKEIEDDSLFCSFCGSKIEQQESKEKQQSTCDACGAALEEGAAFCSACGAAINATEQRLYHRKMAQEITSSRVENERPHATNREMPTKNTEYPIPHVINAAGAKSAQQKNTNNGAKPMHHSVNLGKFSVPVWGIVLAVATTMVVIIVAIAAGTRNKTIDPQISNTTSAVEQNAPLHSGTNPEEDMEGFEKTIQTEYLPAEEIHYDANGKISSHYMKTYDEHGNLLKDKSIIENSWTEYEYDEHGERISEKIYRSNAQGETDILFETKWDIEYAEKGNKQHVVEYWYGFDAQGNRTEKKKIVYSYNKYGLLENVETTSSDERECIEYTYNDEKILIKSNTRNESNAGNVFVKDETYNEAGNRTSDHIERQENGNTVYMSDSNYEYDAVGNLLRSESKISDNGENSFLVTEYAYDSHNNMVSAIYYVNGVLSSSSYREFDYDKDGNTIKSVASGGETVYTYDSNGNLLSEELIDYDIGGSVFRNEYMYDANNNLIRETNYLFGQYRGYTEYTYTPVEKVVYVPIAEETPSADKNLSVSLTEELQAEWMLQIRALAYTAYDDMQRAGTATPEEILLANPYALRMYIYASTDYLFSYAWRGYNFNEAERLTALEDAFGAGCIADDYEAYIPENAIKEKLRNMFGSAAVEGFNFAGIFDNGFFHYEEGDPGDYLALSECEKTNWNDMSQIIFSYEYGYIEEDPDETLGNIVISTQADTTSPYGCVVKQIEWKNIG